MTKVSKEPLISVIVPVYNVEKYLDRCIESIVNQTYKNLEIILVDDGSPDNSPKMCDEWSKKDKRIRVIHKKNGGLSDARNAGIKVAKGEYIGFIDSDDWIDKDMYQILYDNLTKYDADLSCCELVRTRGKNGVDFTKYDKKIEEFTQEDYMKVFFKIGTQKTVYYATCKLYKREIIEKELYPKGLTSEDVVGTFKVLSKCNKIVSINYPYYYYYYNDSSITGSKFSKKDLDLLTIWDIVVDACKSGDQQYLEMAKFNRIRIDYTILMRMALQLKYREIITEYSEVKDKLLINLKQNKKMLLKSSIPISRKITLLMILFNYRFFVFLCHLLKR